jgi:hypothetical protein
MRAADCKGGGVRRSGLPWFARFARFALVRPLGREGKLENLFSLYIFSLYIFIF